MTPDGLVHIAAILPVVLKEISRHVDLRQRMKAEIGQPIMDDDFIPVAEREGVRL